MKKQLLSIAFPLVLLPFLASRLNSTFSSDTLQQDSTSQQKKDTAIVFHFVEMMPVFPGGETQLMEFLRKNINYPKKVREAEIEGRVLVTFVVDEEGSLSEFKLLKDIGYGCGDEVIRVLKLMPNWTPGTQSGKKVKVQYNLPVLFSLETSKKHKKK